MNNLYRNIKKRRQELGMSQNDLAKKLGYTSRSTIAKIESGINDIPQSKIVAFANVLQTTPSYLMGWEDENNQTFESEDIISFEIIGSVAAGYDGAAIETHTGETVPIPASFLKGYSKEDFFVLRVSGDSMYPKILDGDLVLVQRCTSVDSGSIAVVLYNGDEATVKKVKYVIGESWIDLVPYNPEYKTKRIKGENLEYCRILGKVVKLIRDI